MSQIKYEPGSDFACGYMAALAQARVEAAARTRDNVLAEGIAKGYSEGLARGLAQGEVQGRRKMIVRLLTLRFGALSSGLGPVFSTRTSMSWMPSASACLPWQLCRTQFTRTSFTRLVSTGLSECLFTFATAW